MTGTGDAKIYVFRVRVRFKKSTVQMMVGRCGCHINSHFECGFSKG